LERVSLFDTVSVVFPLLNVSAKAKVVKTVYNVLLDRTESVTLGSVRANIADTIVSQNKEIASKPTKTALEQAREAATEWLTNGKGYAYFRKDDMGNIIDILFLDTPDIETAVNVLRVGQSGIGFSHNGVNGPYESAWTIDGRFNADFITSGSLSASLIKAGTLDASLINVINLIAEKVSSKLGNSELWIDGASLNISGRRGKTFFVENYEDNVAYMHFTKYDENGNRVGASQFGANRLFLGGDWITPKFYIETYDGDSNEVFLGIKGNDVKQIYWKNNGDGTSTLMGKD
jgi:hypothetical protein